MASGTETDRFASDVVVELLSEWFGGLAIALIPLFADTFLSIAKWEAPWSHLIWYQEILFAAIVIGGGALLSSWMKIRRGLLRDSGIGTSASLGLLLAFFTITAACMAYGLSRAVTHGLPPAAMGGPSPPDVDYPVLYTVIWIIGALAIVASFIVEMSLANSIYLSTKNFDSIHGGQQEEVGREPGAPSQPQPASESSTAPAPAPTPPPTTSSPSSPDHASEAAANAGHSDSDPAASAQPEGTSQ